MTPAQLDAEYRRLTGLSSLADGDGLSRCIEQLRATGPIVGSVKQEISRRFGARAGELVGLFYAGRRVA